MSVRGMKLENATREALERSPEWAGRMRRGLVTFDHLLREEEDGLAYDFVFCAGSSCLVGHVRIPGGKGEGEGVPGGGREGPPAGGR